jgi:hypothetical protein
VQERHCHADLDRKRRQRNGQAERDGAEHERGCDRVDQSGRGSRSGLAAETCSDGRPFHDRKSLPTRGRITRLKCNLTLIAGEIAAMRLSNHGKTAESVNKTAESVNF